MSELELNQTRLMNLSDVAKAVKQKTGQDRNVLSINRRYRMNNCCCVCGLQVPEGLQVCPKCQRDVEEAMRERKEET